MRKAARAIIIHQHNILLMERNKFGDVYYALLGGGIEAGETADQTVLREVYEEANIHVINPRLVFIEEPDNGYGTQYIFLVDYQDGEAKLRHDSDEAKLNSRGKNLYKPIWVPISKLAGLPFLSPLLKDELLKSMRDGFPKQPKKLSSGA